MGDSFHSAPKEGELSEKMHISVRV